jgi:hypothetical protein
VFLIANPQVLSINNGPAVILLPPPSAGAAWFSGLCALQPEARPQPSSGSGGSGGISDDDGDNGVISDDAAADDDDPFMDCLDHGGGASLLSAEPKLRSPASSVAAASAAAAGRALITIQAHEREIDDCLRCAAGGYQHFRVAFTDSRRGLAGAEAVERTGGEFLHLASDRVQFATAKSYCGVRGSREIGTLAGS